MTESQNVRIDLKHLSDIANLGVRRAAIFMGLGLNAANRKDFRDYQLHKLPILSGQTELPIDMLPSNLPPERVDEFKREFAVWIAGCGLRELLEHYALFLDHVHKFALAVFQENAKLDQVGDPERAQYEFNMRYGIPRKLQELETRFSIVAKQSESICSLYTARNCLTHDLGVVSGKHCNGGEFVLSWLAFDTVAKGLQSREEQPLLALVGQPASEEMQILLKFTLRTMTLEVGDRLRLSQQDLWEICYFFKVHAITSVLESFAAFLKAHNVPSFQENAQTDEEPS